MNGEHGFLKPHKNRRIAAMLLASFVAAAPQGAEATAREPSAPYGATTDITGPDGTSCEAVTNNSPTHLAIMVPSRTEAEWQQFIATTSVTGQPPKATSPEGVSIADCGCSGTLTYDQDMSESQFLEVDPSGTLIVNEKTAPNWSVPDSYPAGRFPLNFTTLPFSVPEGSTQHFGSNNYTCLSYAYRSCQSAVVSSDISIMCTGGKAYITHMAVGTSGAAVAGFQQAGGSPGSMSQSDVPNPADPAIPNPTNTPDNADPHDVNGWLYTPTTDGEIISHYSEIRFTTGAGHGSQEWTGNYQIEIYPYIRLTQSSH